MINSGYSFIAIASIFVIYFYVKKKKLKSNYSDIRTSITLNLSRFFIYKLNKLKFDARNWRPNFLIFSGSPKSRLHLIELANDINHSSGFMTVASLIFTDKLKSYENLNPEKSIRSFLEKRKVNSLTKVIDAENFESGAKNLIKNYGIGAVTPNTIVLGDTTDPAQVSGHVEVIKEAYRREKNVLIIKDTSDTYTLTKHGGQSIDIWWRGKEGNSDLMLALAYMLKTSKKWKNATLNLKSIAHNRDEKQGITENIEKFLEGSRLPASFEVFVCEKSKVFDVIIDNSKNTNIVFLGLNKPDEETDYVQYYNNFINQPPKLKTIVFVLAGQKISFSEIFQ